MAKEKVGTRPAGTGTATAPRTEPSVGGYETFDPDEAQRYNRAGGRFMSITARYPSKDVNIPSFRSGKRFRFVESKTELDQLVARTEEG